MHIDIPGFSIVSTLSETPQASVYLAVDQRSGREVALKVIPAELSQASQALFLARAQKGICQFIHPNIVRIFDVGIIDGRCFFVMEYLPGCHLNHKCFELDLIARLRILIDIARTLEYLDAQGYVHGALTPWNIQVHPSQNHGVLLGLGLGANARQWLNDDHELIAPLSPADALVAAHYASPEQLQGKVLDGRADLYSLGVILFFLLTDHLPFAGASLDELMAQGGSGPVPQLPEHLSVFQPMIDRLLVSDVAARYSSAAQCIAELEALPESVIWQASKTFDDILMASNDPMPGAALNNHQLASANHTVEPTLASRQEPLTENLVALEHQRNANQWDVNQWSAQGLRDDSLLAQQESLSEFMPHEPMHPEPILEASRSLPRLSLFSLRSGITVVTVIVAGLFLAHSNIQLGFNIQPGSDIKGANIQSGQTEGSAHKSTLDAAPSAGKILSFPAEPGLEEQAAVLQVQLQKNFHIATDLMVIYRAALRGDSPQEQAFAKKGLSELQELFSTRIRAWVAANEVEKAQRERALARQLFATEELQPDLARALASAE